MTADARTAEHFKQSALFANMEEASEFFRQGSADFTATCGGRRLDGIKLGTDSWQLQPADVRAVHSSFFDDWDRFPCGSATLDCALLMREVQVTWSPLRPIRVPEVRDGNRRAGCSRCRLAASGRR